MKKGTQLLLPCVDDEQLPARFEDTGSYTMLKVSMLASCVSLLCSSNCAPQYTAEISSDVLSLQEFGSELGILFIQCNSGRTQLKVNVADDAVGRISKTWKNGRTLRV